MPKIVCVVPTVRPDCHAEFVEAWGPLFEKHKVTLITVWDGVNPVVQVDQYGDDNFIHAPTRMWNHPDVGGLICRRTDACRNLGFVAAAPLLTSPDDVVLTLDDDCYPIATYSDGSLKLGDTNDPIQAHLDALSCRVPLGWMNTAHDTDLYLRGVPYGVRDEAPVMLSHGVWVGTPDFDGETQLWLEGGSGVPHSLPYYVGPIPRGVLFPLCGMSVMVKRDAIPYLYYAPMGADSGAPDLHRFADIFMGLWVQKVFAEKGWACYTGMSTIHHTRASDARRNFEQEKLGREWMEEIWKVEFGVPVGREPDGMMDYYRSWCEKRARYADLVGSLLAGDKCREKDSTKT